MNLVHGMKSSGCGVVFGAAGFVFMCVARFPLQIFLPFWSEFSEVMPESGEEAPVVGGFRLGGDWGKHFRSELGSPEGDFVEMAMIWFHALALIAVIALALVFCISERGEERFPF
jgi:hypothetical protein